MKVKIKENNVLSLNTEIIYNDGDKPNEIEFSVRQEYDGEICIRRVVCGSKDGNIYIPIPVLKKINSIVSKW